MTSIRPCIVVPGPNRVLLLDPASVATQLYLPLNARPPFHLPTPLRPPPLRSPPSAQRMPPICHAPQHPPNQPLQPPDPAKQVLKLPPVQADGVPLARALGRNLVHGHAHAHAHAAPRFAPPAPSDARPACGWRSSRRSAGALGPCPESAPPRGPRSRHDGNTLADIVGVAACHGVATWAMRNSTYSAIPGARCWRRSMQPPIPIAAAQVCHRRDNVRIDPQPSGAVFHLPPPLHPAYDGPCSDPPRPWPTRRASGERRRGGCLAASHPGWWHPS